MLRYGFDMSKYTETQLKHLKRYLEIDFRRETKTWIGILSYYRYSIPLAVILVIAMAIYVRPFPPINTFIASGQVGSSYTVLAQEFKKAFTKNGLELEIANSAGLDQGLKYLSDEKSPINASFVSAGTAKKEDYPNLVSLGSVQLSPIWLFYRGKEITTDDPFSYFSKSRIATGVRGSVTNLLFHRFMEINNPGLGRRPNFQEIANADAAERLINGQLDAALIVDGFEAETIQKLLSHPEIHIYSFTLADAYLKKLPMLEKVVIPRGSIDINNVYPGQDITLLASNINLLVEKNVHPAVQWAFLMAAREINLSRDTFFYTAGHFPGYLDKTFPLSPTAERYYSKGIPEVFSFFPLWLATLVDYVWVFVLTLVLVVLPLIKNIIGIRTFNSKKFLWDLFSLLRHLEEDISKSLTIDKAEKLLIEITELEKLVLNSWFEDQDIRFFYTLRSTIEKVKKTATTNLNSIQSKQDSLMQNMPVTPQF